MTRHCLGSRISQHVDVGFARDVADDRHAGGGPRIGPTLRRCIADLNVIALAKLDEELRLVVGRLRGRDFKGGAAGKRYPSAPRMGLIDGRTNPCDGRRRIAIHEGHYISKPPLMAYTAPVIYEESSSNRNRTTRATSSGRPSRRCGIFSTTFASAASGIAETISVAMKPGATQLTVMPFCAISSAKLFENPKSPALDAA